MKLLYQEIANLLGCREESLTDEYKHLCTNRLNWIAKNVLPSGSGIDSGTKIDLDKSTSEKIVLALGFNHLHESGHYECWTEHTAVVTPSLARSFDLKITGRDRNQIKDYLHETYHYVLTQEFDDAVLKDI